MDPNKTLAMIRALVSNQAELDCDPASELAELVLSLDEWLSRGGFLPGDWQGNGPLAALLAEYDAAVAERSAIEDAWDAVDYDDASAVRALEERGDAASEADSITLSNLVALLRKDG